MHGRTCKVLSLIRLLDFASAWSQVPAVTGTAAIYRAPSVPCKHAGHDGTRRGDSASSEHRGREPHRRRGGVHGKQRRGH